MTLQPSENTGGKKAKRRAPCCPAVLFEWPNIVKILSVRCCISSICTHRPLYQVRLFNCSLMLIANQAATQCFSARRHELCFHHPLKCAKSKQRNKNKLVIETPEFRKTSQIITVIFYQNDAILQIGNCQNVASILQKTVMENPAMVKTTF